MKEEEALLNKMLKQLSQNIFQKFDPNNKGELNQQQTLQFFKALFQALQIKQKVTSQQSLLAIREFSDGKLTKQSLIKKFKQMINNGMESLKESQEMESLQEYKETERQEKQEIESLIKKINLQGPPHRF